ncbi:MAG TPA: GNAT family N-acetyltransferase [Bacteroidia bacterium]|nr:GNAT family N-acetyltransferase [Bacteroidia bacterium]
MKELKLEFSPFPELKTERLVFRRITAEDAPEIFSLRSDERAMQFIDRPRAKTMEDALDLIRIFDDGINNNESITWGMALIPDMKIIGSIGFWRIVPAHYRAEIGYMLHPDYHEKGLMTEAVLKMIDFAFEKMGLHSIEANINPKNAASAKLLEKTGFVKEAYFRENYFYNGKFLDSMIYSLVNNSY